MTQGGVPPYPRPPAGQFGLTASLVIPWAASDIKGQYQLAQVGVTFRGEPRYAEVLAYAINTETNRAVHPAVFDAHIGGIDYRPDWLRRGEAWLPASLITVRGLIGRIEAVAELLPDRRPFFSKYVIQDLQDFVLSAASYALAKWSGSGEAQGPISAGDMLDDGMILLEVAQANSPIVLPLHGRAPLGTWSADISGSAVPASKADGEPDLEVSAADASGSSLSVLRLRTWIRRAHLRLARCEWDEAVVAAEASFEQFTWFVLEALLLDHGYKRADFETEHQPQHVRQALGVLQAHLKGPNEKWEEVRRQFRNGTYGPRNSTVHRGDLLDAETAYRSLDAGRLLADLVCERLSDCATGRAHPIATYLVLGRDSEGVLGPVATDRLRQALDTWAAPDLRDLNGAWPRPLVAPAAAPRECWATQPPLDGLVPDCSA